MKHTDDAFAAMLLTLPLTPGAETGEKPLSPVEFRQILGRLDMDAARHPGLLMGKDLTEIMRLMRIDEHLAYRLCILLDRDILLYRLLDECMDTETEIVTCFDLSFPQRLALRQELPVCLFARGELSLCEGEYVGVAGIPGVKTPADVEKGLIALADGAAMNGLGILTGGEAGAGRIVRERMLENEGRLLCALTGGMNDFCTDAACAEALKNGNLCVLSACHPDSPADIKEIPARNRILFALSCACVVAAADAKRSEAEAARMDLCTFRYALKHPELGQNEGLFERGFEPVRDLNGWITPERAGEWTGSRAEQIRLF